MMKQSEILSRKKIKYFLDFPKKPEVKYFPKSGRTFMLYCTVRKHNNKEE